MKILFKIISAFLYFNFVSSVQMYYIYDETPNAGYASGDNSIGTYMNIGFSMGKASKKQFMSSYSNPKFQKINNEHVVDAHFKVRKNPSRPYAMPAVADTGRLITYETNEGKTKAQRIVEEYRTTEAPLQLQHNLQHQQMINTAGQQNNKNKQVDYDAKPNEVASHTQSSNNQQIPPIRPKAVNADYNSIRQQNQDAGKCQKNQRVERGQRNHRVERGQRNIDLLRKQRNLDLGRGQRQQDLGRGRRQNTAGRGLRQNDAGRSQINQDGGYDSQLTYMNVRQASRSVEPQTIILNGNHKLTSFSEISPDKRQRTPTSMKVDKTLHKASGIAKDHHKEVMTRFLDDIVKKIINRRERHIKGEYVSKNIEDHLDTIYDKSKRSLLAESLRKYIGKEKTGKDRRSQHKHITALARIGSHEESLEDNTPYAVFYRMNPESLDQQDGFMMTRSMDDNESIDFSSKEKRLHTTFQENTESMTAIQNSKRNGGQRKKLKKFGNFINY